MKTFVRQPGNLLGAVLLIGLLAIGGCNFESHPDQRQAVYESLANSNLRSVIVKQDRHTGVMTLSGIVGSSDSKSQAETVARQAAPGYSINNQIQVDSAGLEGMEKKAAATAAMDHAIEDHFKLTIKSHKNLEKQDIQFTAENGTLYLKGSVQSDTDKRETQELAKKEPQVQQVVNEIKVTGTPRHSAANS